MCCAAVVLWAGAVAGQTPVTRTKPCAWPLGSDQTVQQATQAVLAAEANLADARSGRLPTSTSRRSTPT
ncbi:MAG: hypothetical protein IPH86_17495 [bacterium]|nr:hypothetical protein [bacterium]